MADLVITATSVLASAQATTEARWNFGTTFTQGQPGYVDTSNTWQLADNNASATTAAVSGISLNAGGPGQPARFNTADPAFMPGATLTVGQSYYLSSTAGGICPVSDLPSGAYPQFLFVAYTAALATLKIVNGTGVKP